MIPASVMITIRTGSQRWSPNARSETNRVMATSSCRANEPLASSSSLRGETATLFQVAPDLAHRGEYLPRGQLAQPGYGQGQPGHQRDHHHDGQGDPDQFRVEA